MANPKRGTQQAAKTGAVPAGVQPRYLTARTAEEFRQREEGQAFEEWLGNQSSMSQSQRRRTARFVERAIDALGLETLNAAIDDLDTFEYRLTLVDPKPYGYQDYITKTFKHAVRHLVAWAYNLNGEDARRFVERPHPTKKQAQQRGYEALELIPANSQGGATSGKTQTAAAKQTNNASKATATTPQKTPGRKPGRPRKAEQDKISGPTKRTRRQKQPETPQPANTGATQAPTAKPSAAKPAASNKEQPHLLRYITEMNEKPDAVSFDELEEAFVEHAQVMQRAGLLNEEVLLNMVYYTMPSLSPEAKFNLIKQMPGGLGRTLSDTSLLSGNASLQEFMTLLLFERIYPNLKSRFTDNQAAA